MRQGKLLSDWGLHQYGQSARVQTVSKLISKRNLNQNKYQWPLFLLDLFFFQIVLFSSLKVTPLDVVPLLHHFSFLECLAARITPLLSCFCFLLYSVKGKRMDQASTDLKRFVSYINLFVFIQHYCQFRCNMKFSSLLANN